MKIEVNSISEIRPKLTKRLSMKTLIGIPTYDKKDYCWVEFVSSIKRLKSPVYMVDTSEEIDSLRYDAEEEGFYYKHIQEEKRMNRVIRARNEIIDYAIKNNYDYILFVDSDVIVPKDTIERLMDLIKENSIVSGFYIVTNKLGLPTPAAKFIIQNEVCEFESRFINNNVHDVDAIGMGCCLMPKEIFTKYKFRCERGEYGDVTKAEDICFCDDISKDNIKILFDTSLVCAHKISDDSTWEGKDV